MTLLLLLALSALDDLDLLTDIEAGLDHVAVSLGLPIALHVHLALTVLATVSSLLDLFVLGHVTAA